MQQETASRQTPAAPAVATAGARNVRQVVGIADVELAGGFWGHWQQVNRDVSIPLGMQRLDAAGNLRNLQLAAGETTGEYTRPLFMDSDLYKTLEAIGWELGRGADPTLHGFVTDAAALLSRAQCADGYLNSYYQVVEPERRYAWLAHSHEMYCAGHLIQAALAVVRTTGDEGLLAVARRFADHLVETFLHGGNPGIDGHPEIETALVELYRHTGHRDYLELARHLVDQRGQGLVGESGRGATYFQDHETVREADTLVGHAVRALYLEAGVVDVAVETGDEELLAASIRRWEDMVATKTSLTGGLGSRHAGEAFGDRYELPPDRAYNETCAAIASIHWSWRLLLATGEARYAELIERTLYNGFAASTASDGTRFFYVNPLQRRPDHLEGDRDGRRREWFSCACCPPNIMRLVSSLGAYAATVTSVGVQLQQFASGTVSADLEQGTVRLAVETDYPWSGAVSVTVVEAPDAEWELSVRVPSWSPETQLSVNGEEVAGSGDDHDYRKVSRAWAAGDVVTFGLDLQPRLVYPHRRIDALRGCVAVERGPLVYCFEQVDQADGVAVDDLALTDIAPEALEPTELPGVGRTVVVRADAVATTQPTSADLPYETVPGEQLASRRSVTAVAVPYVQWDNRDGGAMRVWLPRA